MAKEQLKIQNPPPTLREMALENMRNAIISGVFAPGERLVERTLCEQIGVSRTVIREVIRHLDTEGLVTVVPHQGPVVATMDWDQAQQIYDIRALLEASAAADCARKIAEADCQRLEAAITRVIDQSSERGASAVLEDTALFYEIIFKSAGHDLAYEIVQRLNGRISRLRVLTLSHGERLQQGPSRLKDIFDAIKARNPEQAAEACRTHVLEAKAIAAQIFAE